MRRLRIGVIGCGRISSVYVQVFKSLSEDVTVCYAVDKVRERAKEVASHFPGCGYSQDIQALLEQKPDVVHVLTPHFLHKEHVIKALKAGCNVLTEKPIALSVADAEEMISVAGETGKQLGVIFQNRYIEGVQEAKRLLTEGRMGKLTGAWSTLNWWRPASYYQCDWKGSWEKEGGGVVIDQAIHSIDLVRHLMGCEVVSIKAQIDRRVLQSIEVEDVASAAIRFENDAVYSFYACNYYTSNSPIRVELTCERGTVLLTEDMVTIVRDNKEHTIRPIGVDNDGERYWGGYHQAQIKDFYDKLQSGRPVPIEPADAAKTLAVVLGIYRSAKENCAVKPEAILATEKNTP